MPTWTSPKPSATRASPLVVFAAKASRGGKGGDGGAPKRQAAPGNPPAAPRITGKVGRMSVHTQIKLVERYKSLSGGAGAKTTAGPKGGSAVNKATVEKSTFRKTKDDAYQEELARRRAAKQAEARHMETLKSFKGGNGAPPTLIVDGYNVCGCDEGEKAGLGMKEAFMAGDLETAQKRLVDELDTLGAHKGYRIVCVFDADRTAGDRGGGSGGLDAAWKTKAGTWVVFSVTNDADSWIERASIEELKGESSVDKVLRKTRQANAGRVASETERFANRDDERNVASAGDASGDVFVSAEASAKKNSRLVYVATSDNALSSVVRGNGAYAVSAGSLVEELTRARSDETEILRELAVKARWGGEKRGLAMVTKDASTADKLMEMYKAAPNTTAVEKFGSRTGGFSSKPRKGKKNKGKK
jgi:predicted RNA-binding protein with PIN domain